MKIIFLLILIPLNVLADNYIYYLDKNIYNSSIKVVDDNTPSCGSAGGVPVDLKPINNLCEKGYPSVVITMNGVHTWNCENEEQKIICNANQIINTSKHSSCKNMLLEYPQLSGKDGVYEAILGGLNSKLYCNMSYNGGGWTLVLAQFEDDVEGWNEGIKSDYDPSLSTNKSFALNNAQLPEHTQISIGYQKNIINSFNYTYNTGNLTLSNIIGLEDNKVYQIHRNNGHFFNWHDPERGIVYDSNYYYWRNTILIHPLNDNSSFYFAFSPNAIIKNEKGFSNNSLNLSATNENYSWSIFVR